MGSERLCLHYETRFGLEHLMFALHVLVTVMVRRAAVVRENAGHDSFWRSGALTTLPRAKMQDAAKALSILTIRGSDYLLSDRVHSHSDRWPSMSAKLHPSVDSAPSEDARFPFYVRRTAHCRHANEICDAKLSLKAAAV